jgi:hypothetical protein
LVGTLVGFALALPEEGTSDVATMRRGGFPPLLISWPRTVGA